MIRSLIPFLVLVSFPFLPPAVFAQEEDPATSHPAETHEGGHAFHANHVSAFVGGATHLDNEDTAFAFGGHYTRRFTPRWAVGIIGEYATSDIERDLLLVGGGAFSVTPALGLLAGAGVELATRDVEHEGHVEEEEETELLLRFGAVYAIPVAQRWALAPELFADWTKHTWTLVYGVSLGYGF